MGDGAGARQEGELKDEGGVTTEGKRGVQKASHHRDRNGIETDTGAHKQCTSQKITRI